MTVQDKGRDLITNIGRAREREGKIQAEAHLSGFLNHEFARSEPRIISLRARQRAPDIIDREHF